MKLQRYNTDVLVIGGGGAATASTIAAHDAGARTMLAVKGRFGIPGVRGAGATSNPIGDFWTIRTVGPKGGFFNPPELVHADMLQSGLGMADPALCQIFVDEVSDAVKRLQSMGMRFQSKMLATMEGHKSDLKTNRIVAVQKAVIEGTNTQVLEHANFTDLVVDNGRCSGAVGVTDDGEPFVVEAGAVVIATGGVGQLFTYSFNPPGNTGDGYAMAARAGADLFNMEYMQQGLATTWPQQAIVMLYEMEEPYRLINKHGKSFLQDYYPDADSMIEGCNLKAAHWPVSCRDASLHIDRAIKNEVLAGRGTENNAVFLDLSHATRGFKHELFENFMIDNGIDIKNDLVQVQIHHHSSNGGIRIDERAESTVSGLYAVGEAGGWQGADRLGGTMLGGSQVFGWRAGRFAGEQCSSRPQVSISDDDALAHFDALRTFQKAKGEVDIDTMRRELQYTMWKLLTVEKDATTLAEARDYIAADRQRLNEQLAIREPLDYALAYEQRNLHDVAEVIIETADMRKESRGAHYRSDYPERDDANWLTNLFATHKNGELEVRREWINEANGWEDDPDDIRISPWG
ncbi:MAG: FAD-binding protein [Pseudomonadota bacterium]